MAQPWVVLNYKGNIRDLTTMCDRSQIPYVPIGSYIAIPAKKIEDFCMNNQMEYVNVRSSGAQGYDIADLQPKTTPEITVTPEATTAKAKFIEFSLARFKGLDRDISGQIGGVESQITAKVAELTELYAQKENLQEQLRICQEQGVGSLAEVDIAQEFDGLLRSSKIARIEFDQRNSYLVVYTKPLRHRERAGAAEFIIKINLNPGRLVKDDRSPVNGVKGIFIEKVSGWNHPHYDESWGACATPYYCLGNAAGLSYDAMREYKIALAIDILIKYLEEG